MTHLYDSSPFHAHTRHLLFHPWIHLLDSRPDGPACPNELIWGKTKDNDLFSIGSVFSDATNSNFDDDLILSDASTDDESSSFGIR